MSFRPPPRIVEQLVPVPPRRGLTTCASAPAQHAALFIFSQALPEITTHQRAELQKRCDLLVDGLAAGGR